MKKHLFYLLALMLTFSASCSKDPEGLEVEEQSNKGKYTLSSLSADTENAQSRASIGTNGVVNWSAKDRILVVNPITKEEGQYILVSGANTPIGKFEPMSTADEVTYNDPNELRAIYPVIAADFDKTSGDITLTINKDWGADKANEQRLDKIGMTLDAWTTNKNNVTAFSNNDIKVSYKVFETGGQINFKFRQLGTWCTFAFDFTADELVSREMMKEITVSTSKGLTPISGTAKIDFTDPINPTLEPGTETVVKWVFQTASNMTVPFTRSLMLLPGVHEQLKIAVKTTLRELTFYATPAQALVAGTTLQFPINYKQNFTAQVAGTDFGYVENEIELNPFYYYGKTNCVLAAMSSADQNVQIDVTPHRTDPYYNISKEVENNAPKPTSAKIIWAENTLTGLGTPTLSGNTVTLSVKANTSGNALVGIYGTVDGKEKLLWSYHVWVPEYDPRTALLEYPLVDGSHEIYEVMPMALGAMTSVDRVLTSEQWEQLKSNSLNTAVPIAKLVGCYYQWGRKDPLGRWSGIASNTGYVATTPNEFATTYKVEDILADKEQAETEAGTPDDEKIADDRYMIEYSIAHPVNFLINSTGSWCSTFNHYLWGNPNGYESPRASQISRSIFDPCPEGYRIPPKNLWLNFTTSRGNENVSSLPDAPTRFNLANIDTHVANRGFLGYRSGSRYAETEEELKQRQVDFYPVTGRREVNSAQIGTLTYAFGWSSAPVSATSSTAYTLALCSTYVQPIASGYIMSYGFPVRCVKYTPQN